MNVDWHLYYLACAFVRCKRILRRSESSTVELSEICKCSLLKDKVVYTVHFVFQNSCVHELWCSDRCERVLPYVHIYVSKDREMVWISLPLWSIVKILIEVVNLSEFYDKIRRKKYRSHLVTIIITVCMYASIWKSNDVKFVIISIACSQIKNLQVPYAVCLNKRKWDVNFKQ